MVRAIALVVVVVLAVIGIGVAIAGGIEPHGVPLGWVPIYDQEAQLSVPPTWHVVYNSECALHWSPGVIYVQTTDGNGTAVPCAVDPVGTSPNLPEMVVWPYEPTDLTGLLSRTINGIRVWSDKEGFLFVPDLGVMVYASGTGVNRILDTLTTAPA